MADIPLSDWRYYNHAMLPNISPEQEISVIDWDLFWDAFRTYNPYMARWTTHFDCSQETPWWWVIREAPYSLESLSSSVRKHIRQAFKKCRVCQIDIAANKDALWSVYQAAFSRYTAANNYLSKEQFFREADTWTNQECWGAYDLESGALIGWMTCRCFDRSVVIKSAKYHPEYMNKHISDAIHHAICQHYLCDQEKSFIAAGERTVNHISNSQAYKIETFRFRKAYCRLHIQYNRKMALAVKLLYPFRKCIACFRKFPLFHSIDAVLQMETINRWFQIHSA